jgi:DNA-binding NtrC family response regulator
MKKEDLNLFRFVEFRTDDGTMFLKDLRMVMIDATSFLRQRSVLIKAVGEEKARKSVMRMGYCEGFFSSLAAQSMFGPHEGFVVAPQLLSAKGMFRPEVQFVCEDPSKFEVRVQFYNSVEAEQYSLYCGLSEIPVCWWAVGFGSGYSSAERGFEIYFKEEACSACGTDHCSAVGRAALGWKDELQEIREDYGFRDFKDVEALWKEMRQNYSLLVGRKGKAAAGALSQGGVAIRKQTLEVLENSRFIVREETMLEVLDQAICVARLNTPVLIQGETGTGKEFLVNLIHDQSARGRQELVSVNCAALTETLLESELFGHVRGAFTGAVSDKAGLFELAANGTLFLDEIGEMPLTLQAKLLRAIENGEIRRVGSNKTIQAKPRIIAATNRNLQEMSATGRFRKDLYFRLNSFVIQIPPLRERTTSIPAMIQLFLDEVGCAYGKKVSSVCPDAFARLMAYKWPGNVRELKHAIERAVVVTRFDSIQLRDLPIEIANGNASCSDSAPYNDSASFYNSVSHSGKIDSVGGERQFIATILAEHRGDRTATAHALNFSTSTLWRKMKRYGLLDSTDGCSAESVS